MDNKKNSVRGTFACFKQPATDKKCSWDMQEILHSPGKIRLTGIKQ